MFSCDHTAQVQYGLGRALDLTRSVFTARKYAEVREGQGKRGRMQGSDYYNHWLEFTLDEEIRENIKEAKNSKKAVESVTGSGCAAAESLCSSCSIFSKHKESEIEGAKEMFQHFHFKDGENHIASWRQGWNPGHSWSSFVSATLWIPLGMRVCKSLSSRPWLLGDPGLPHPG